MVSPTAIVRDCDVPRPTQIFVAAKENSSACSGRSGNEVRVRFHSLLPRRRMVPPAERRRNASVHRFLISSPNLGIDASFSRFKPSCVHRFLISGPNLGIDVRKPSRTAQRLHRFLISSPDLRIDAAKRSKQGHPSIPRAGALCRGRGMPDGQGLRTA